MTDQDGYRRILKTTFVGGEFTSEALLRRTADDGGDAVFAAGGSISPQELPLQSRIWGGGLAARSPVPLPHESSERFSLIEVIGSGANGEVYLAKDLNIQRHVAVKFLKREALSGEGGISRFIHEARVTARLQHPGIVPVYDLDFTDDGRIFYSMGRIEGESLGWILENSSQERLDALRQPNAFVSLILKMCETIAYAHSKGVVHQDIKPDNIMLGSFGEVLVVDWGTSSDISGSDGTGAARLMGTPAYMSPEQANCKQVDERSDVWCIGATMFHILFGRFPAIIAEPGIFWEHKRKGRIAEPTPAERLAVSAPLVSIVLKTLQADPDRRYPTVLALAEDLRNFQAGLAVSAHRDTIAGFLARWYRRRRSTIWTGFLVMILFAAIGWFMYIWKLKEVAEWGRPIASEYFSDSDGWRSRWLLHAGQAEVRDGRLISASDLALILLHKTSISGGTAIEFEGEMLPGLPAGDLSVVWCDGIGHDSTKDPLENLHNAHLLQVGAYANSMAMIRQGQTGAVLDYSGLKLEHGRRYRIRAEVDGTRFSISVDGRTVCTYDASFPMVNGYIGIYGFGRGKAFDNVQVYAKGVAERIPATGGGDALFRAGHYREAATAFEEVIRSHGDRPISDEARFKIGLCYEAQGEMDSAARIWRNLADTPYGGRAELKLLDHSFSSDEHQSVCAELEHLAKQGGHSLRQATLRWSLYAGDLLKDDRFDVIDRYLDVRYSSLRSEVLSQFVAAKIYERRGDWKRIIDECSAVPWIHARAMQILGLHREAAERYPDITWITPWSLIALGRDEEALRRFPNNYLTASIALWYLDRPEEILVSDDLDTALKAMTLIRLDRDVEVLERFPDAPEAVLLALRRLGRLDEAAQRLAKWPSFMARALLHQRRYEEVLERFPEDQDLCAEALAQLGRWDEIPLRTPKASRMMALLHLRARDFAGVRAATKNDFDLSREFEAYIAERLGNDEQIIEHWPEFPDIHGAALIRLGRAQQIVDGMRQNRDQVAAALLALDRPSDVIARFRDQIDCVRAARMVLALDDAAKGRAAQCLSACADLAKDQMASEEIRLIAPLMPLLLGESRQASSALFPLTADRRDGAEQRLWHQAAWLSGMIDDQTFLAQPGESDPTEKLEMLRLLAADLRGDPNASAGWSAWASTREIWLRSRSVWRALARWRGGAEHLSPSDR